MLHHLPRGIKLQGILEAQGPISIPQDGQGYRSLIGVPAFAMDEGLRRFRKKALDRESLQLVGTSRMSK